VAMGIWIKKMWLALAEIKMTYSETERRQNAGLIFMDYDPV